MNPSIFNTASSCAKPVGIDIAKHVFQWHGVDKLDKVVLKERIYREDLLSYMSII
jgi:hypothetical protein